MSSKCPICDEPYNKTSRVSVCCTACKHSVCRGCLTNWLRSSTTTAPSCMECKRSYEPMELSEQLPQSWMKTEFRQAIGRWLIHESKAWEIEAKANAIKENKMKELQTSLTQIHEEIRILRARAEVIRNQIDEVRDSVVTDVSVINCPVTNCKGWVIPGMQCSICKSQVCRECEGLSEEGHVCDPNVLSTLQTIKQVSKNCPRCSAPIQRIEGCNQMWCTNCNGAFNWDSGKVVTSLRNFFNPHMPREQLGTSGLRRGTLLERPEMAAYRAYRKAIGDNLDEESITTKLSQAYLKASYERDLSVIRNRWMNDPENPEATESLELLRFAYGKSRAALINE